MWKVTLVVLAVAGIYLVGFKSGANSVVATQTQTALEVTQEALVLADEQGRIDTGIALVATESVQAVRTETEGRRGVVARADLQPARVAPGGDHALVCPDVLSGPFVRLYNGEADGDHPDPTGPSPAGGVPGGRGQAGGAPQAPP